jgi:hypothetical protein
MIPLLANIPQEVVLIVALCCGRLKKRLKKRLRKVLGGS